jgi:hypothetical protein
VVHTAAAPWRGRSRSLLLAFGVAVSVAAFTFGLDWRGLAAGLAAGVATLGLAAFFTWTWEQVTLTRGELVIETAEGITETPLGGLRATRLPDGSALVEGPEGPLLASAASPLAPREAVLLGDADLNAIWERLAPTSSSPRRPS